MKQTHLEVNSCVFRINKLKYVDLSKAIVPAKTSSQETAMFDGIRQRKREFWIALILFMPLFSITIGIYAGVSSATRSTPDRTLAGFCKAMQSGNTPRAYSQYSSRYQRTYSKQQFESDMSADAVISCSYNSISVSNSGDRARAWLRLAYASGATEKDTVILSQDSSNKNEWKIDRGMRLSTPGRMLDTFCASLQAGDYQAAHAKFVGRYQREYPTQQLKYDVSVDKVVSCTHSPVSASGTSALAMLTFVHASGVLDNDIIILSQGRANAWKIENGINLATPIRTLAIFCSAMHGGDYQAAYDQLSNAFQDMVPEPQFATIFSQNKITLCNYGPFSIAQTRAEAILKLSNTAGLAYRNIVNFVQQGISDWKIDSFMLL
jgi:limonene-1,2-epoxide hydrolase